MTAAGLHVLRQLHAHARALVLLNLSLSPFTRVWNGEDQGRCCLTGGAASQSPLPKRHAHVTATCGRLAHNRGTHGSVAERLGLGGQEDEEEALANGVSHNVCTKEGELEGRGREGGWDAGAPTEMKASRS